MALTIVYRNVFHDILPIDHKILEGLRQDAVNLTGYSYRGGEWLPSTISLVEKNRKGLPAGRKLQVMDVGPGRGEHLGEFSKHANVQVYTFGPHNPNTGHPRIIHLPHWMEETVIPDAMDIIQSRWGAIHHSANRAVALENALNSLRPGGQLVLHHHELSGLPAELEHYSRRHPRGLEEEMRQCMRQYRESTPRLIKRMREHDAFYAAYHALQELQLQGFEVPTDEQIARAHAHGGDFVIRRGKQKADLTRHYDNKAVNKIRVYI